MSTPDQKRLAKLVSAFVGAIIHAGAFQTRLVFTFIVGLPVQIEEWVSTIAHARTRARPRSRRTAFTGTSRDVDGLAIALIELGGRSLRAIIREARSRVRPGFSVIRPPIKAFMEQLDNEGHLLHILLREGMVGSDAYKAAVERELRAFKDELAVEVIRLSDGVGRLIHAPALVATAITRLVFAMAATALDLPRERRGEVVEQLVTMLRMIVIGAHQLARETDGKR